MKSPQSRIAIHNLDWDPAMGQQSSHGHLFTMHTHMCTHLHTHAHRLSHTMCPHLSVHTHNMHTQACVPGMSSWDMVPVGWGQRVWSCRESTSAGLSWQRELRAEASRGFTDVWHGQGVPTELGCGQAARVVVSLPGHLAQPYSTVAEGPHCVLPPPAGCESPPRATLFPGPTDPPLSLECRQLPLTLLPASSPQPSTTDLPTPTQSPAGPTGAGEASRGSGMSGSDFSPPSSMTFPPHLEAHSRACGL